MNSFKLKADLTDPKHVAAMAAFFNTLNGAAEVAAPVFNQMAQAGQQASRAGKALAEAAIEAKPTPEQLKAEVEAAKPEATTEAVEPCEADRLLSFSELKAKFPATKAKSKEVFLERIGLGPVKEETTTEETTTEETTTEETTTEETTTEEATTDEQQVREQEQTEAEAPAGEKIDAVLVKKTMSECINVKDMDLKQERKKALREKLNEYGAKNVSAVPEDKFAEFVTFMRSL